jgi:hypothetical protein
VSINLLFNDAAICLMSRAAHFLPRFVPDISVWLRKQIHRKHALCSSPIYVDVAALTVDGTLRFSEAGLGMSCQCQKPLLLLQKMIPVILYFSSLFVPFDL